MYYFIRANGATVHNNPGNAECYVLGEGPKLPETKFNGLDYCFANDIVRIGWPDVGDLRYEDGRGALCRCYRLTPTTHPAAIPGVKPYIAAYLRAFEKIQIGDIVLVPDKDNSGDVYISEVTGPYRYFHDIRNGHPYEHAHRLPVRWDRDSAKCPVKYRAEALGIPTQGGIWLRAFAKLGTTAPTAAAIAKIDLARAGT